MTTETSNARGEWKPIRFFAYDSDNGGYNEFKTLPEAIASAQESLSYAGDDGWPDGGPTIVYGAVLGETREVEGSRRPSDNPDFEFLIDYELTTAATPPPTADAEVRNREADRARFSDQAFNDWLDTGISDAGHTVWDAVGDMQAAWAGWEARQFAGDAVLISECCGREECGGECGNEWRGMGMYRKPAACAGNMDGQRPVTPDMARDAERYRFLRGDHGPTSVRWPRWKIEHWTGFWNPVHGSDLDAAIDAAMREAGS